MRRSAMLLLGLALLAASCGDDGGAFTTTAPSTTQAESTTTTGTPDTTSTSEPPPDTSTTATSTSTTTTTTSTTTTAPEPVYLVDPAHFFPPVFLGSNGAHGSGCVTPGFDALPNGVWFGFAEGVGGGHITFDLACFWTGAPACEAQMDDGFASSPDDCLDYYIQNNVAATFNVPLAGDARVWYVDMTSGDVSSPAEIPLGSWPSPDSYQDCPGEYCSVWLYVNAGRITGIVEQYVP